jgi:hypothetical protein
MPDGKQKLGFLSMTDLNSIMKYIKVKALADGGAPGERNNAQAILAKMEAENPGIKERAAAVIRAQNGETEKGRWPAGNPFSGDWANIFQFAGQAANYAYGFAQAAVNAQYGALLANRVTSYNRNTRAGKYIIGLRMEEETYWEATSLNAAQKEMFRNELHELLDEQLNEMLVDD